MMQHDKNKAILDNTESVCPICLEVIEARIVVKDRVVYLEKECPVHGSVTTYLWPDVEHYQWMNGFKLPYILPKLPIPSERGCTKDCGLCTSHLRQPTLVEIEVTEGCNLRCPVCFMGAEENQKSIPPDADMETIENMYKEILRKTGPQTSIQITGGEPTTRKNLSDIVLLGRFLGFSAIEINTNGVMIGKDPAYVQELAEAGISGIYLQFDGLTSSVYEKIRGADLLERKLKAIENCRKAGVQVVLAMTVIAGINDDQLGAVLEFAMENRDVIVGIAYQPAFGSGRFEVPMEQRLTMGDVIFMLSEQSKGLLEPYDFWPLGCAHPLCDSSTYITEEQGKFGPLTRRITRQEYFDNFDPTSPQGSVFADIAEKKFPELSPGLSIVIMNYMDALNMDLKRLKECSMIVADKEGRLIPFCAYQLTNVDGKKRDELAFSLGRKV